RDPALVPAYFLRPAGHGRPRPGLARLGPTGPGLAGPGLAGFGRVTLASWHHDLLVHDLRDWGLAYPGFEHLADRTGPALQTHVVACPCVRHCAEAPHAARLGRGAAIAPRHHVGHTGKLPRVFEGL